MSFRDVHCSHCKRFGMVELIDAPCDALKADGIPTNWIISDHYPPGDEGLIFFCSEDCLKLFWETHE